MGRALTIRSIEHEPRPEILASKVMHGLQDKAGPAGDQRLFNGLHLCNAKHRAMLQARVQESQDPRDRAPSGIPCVPRNARRLTTQSPISNGPYSACAMQRRPSYTIAESSLASLLTRAPGVHALSTRGDGSNPIRGIAKTMMLVAARLSGLTDASASTPTPDGAEHFRQVQQEETARKASTVDAPPDRGVSSRASMAVWRNLQASRKCPARGWRSL